jgi:hypothetical protein
MDLFPWQSFYQVLINHIIFFKILKIVDIELNIKKIFERFSIYFQHSIQIINRFYLFLLYLYTEKKKGYLRQLKTGIGFNSIS